MYEKLENCPSCNSSEFVNHIICDDFSVSQESFAIMKCTNCDLLVTSPRPDLSSIGKYYESQDYISHTNKGNGIINSIYKQVRKYTLKKKYQLIDSLTDKKKILDYGCGTGEWLHYLDERGWKTQGIEPNPNARQKAIDEYNLEISADLNPYDHKKYSVITLWHVLEHVHDIPTLLNQLKSILSKKGKLVIAVPNHASYDRKYYKQYWAAYDVPRHLFHFNQLTIKDLMSFHGFQLEKIVPMKFDSYYVSMLSERYKKGKTNYFISLIIGWLSNRWAKKHENNYSSLTYIFRKA